MAISATFPYTNTTDSTKTLKLKQLSVKSDYSEGVDTATKWTAKNRTSAIDFKEIISYTSNGGSSSSHNQKNYYPSKIRTEVAFGVDYDVLVKFTDSDDSTWREDNPISVSIKMSAPVNGRITAEMVEASLIRAISALYTNDGTCRIADLMLESPKPSED